MSRFILTAALIATICAAPLMAAIVPISDDATLSVCWESRATDRLVDIFVDGAMGHHAWLHFSWEPPVPGPLSAPIVNPPGFILPLDAFGSGHFQKAIPLDFFPRDFPLWITAVFMGPDGRERTPGAALLLGGAWEEILDFDWAFKDTHWTIGPDWYAQGLPYGPFMDGGRPTLTGEVISEQWAPAGVHIWADNRTEGHPDKAIIFDSDLPTGDDPDLATPGYGPDNLVAEGKLLIIAENDWDATGDNLVDDPDDEMWGGVVYFDFDYPVTICSLKLIDTDQNQPNEVRFYDNERLLQRIPFPSKADNCATRLEMFCYDTRRVEVDFGGSGGIAYLGVMPCPTRVEYDWTTYAAPLPLVAGEVLTDQMDQLGMRFEAINAIPGLPDKAIMFNTANPTGNDDDLVTPGYGWGNDFPLRHVVVIAENDIDVDPADGLVDDPNDSGLGGVIAIDFTSDRWIREALVMDIEGYEPSWISVYDAFGFPLGPPILIETKGDNSVQIVPIDVMGVRRFELHLGGSGALAGLDFCPDIPLP